MLTSLISLPITNRIKSSVLYFVSVCCLLAYSLSCMNIWPNTGLYYIKTKPTSMTCRLFYKQTVYLETERVTLTFYPVRRKCFCPIHFIQDKLCKHSVRCWENGPVEIPFTLRLDLICKYLHIFEPSFYDIPYNGYWICMEIVHNIKAVFF